MSRGAGEDYKGYYIRTETRKVNGENATSSLYDSVARIWLDADSMADETEPDLQVEGEQAFPTEFEAHRYAERVERQYIDKLEAE